MADTTISKLNVKHAPDRTRGLWGDALHRLRRHRLGMVGAFILLVTVVLALFGPSLVPYDPNVMDFNARFAPP